MQKESGYAMGMTDISALIRAEVELDEKKLCMLRDWESTKVIAKSAMENTYCRGRAALAIVTLHEIRSDKYLASQEIDRVITFAKAAVKMDRSHSDSRRLLGEGYGRLIRLRGGITGLLYGTRSNTEVTEALKLDPNNYRAWLAMGIWKLRAPRMVGGNIVEAAGCLRRAYDIAPTDLLVRIWLGIVLREFGDRKGAAQVLCEVREDYKETPWAIWAEKELGSS